MVTPGLIADFAPSRPYPGYTAEKPLPPAFGNFMDPLAVLTSAATVTTTARLGSSTLNATWCHPLLLGRTLTTLDQRAGENGPVAGWRHRRRCVVWE